MSELYSGIRLLYSVYTIQYCSLWCIFEVMLFCTRGELTRSSTASSFKLFKAPFCFGDELDGGKNVTCNTIVPVVS